MRSRSLFAVIALSVCTAGIATALTFQDKGKEKPVEKGKAAPAAAPAMDPAMMEAMKKYATPGAEHKMLESRAGKWKGKGKFWMAPDAPVMESDVDTEYAMSMGRYLTDTTHGNMMGEAFEGHGVTGFDNLKKKYVSTWIDSSGTGIMAMEGSYDAGTKTMTLTGECPDPVAGKYTPMKMIEKDTDANSFVLEMHCTDTKSGKLFKCMEITYTRAK